MIPASFFVPIPLSVVIFCISLISGVAGASTSDGTWAKDDIRASHIEYRRGVVTREQPRWRPKPGA